MTVAASLSVLSVLAVDPWGLAPHSTLRWTVVSTAALLAVALADVGSVRPPRWLLVGWVVVLGGLGLAAAGGVDPLHAWIGTPDRRLGWLSWVGFAALCAVGLALGQGPAGHRRTLVRGAVTAGLCLAGGAVLDAVGLLPEDGVRGRIGGTYGQPAYLAAMGTLLLPLSVALARDAGEGRWWRVAAGGASLGVAAAVLASGTRGSWLGLAAGGLFALRMWRRERPCTTRRAGATALVVVAGLLLLLTPVAPRAASGLDVTQGTAAGRLAEWRVAARVIAADPWLGVGPEGYRIAFPGAVDRSYGRSFGRDVIPDRAHSGPLDVTATGGVVVGLAWLGLLAGLGRAAWRSMRSEDPMLVGIGVAVVAYGVQQLWLFPLAEVDGIWWLFAGVLVAGPRPRTWPGGRGRGRAVSWVALLLLAPVVVIGGLGITADRRMARAAAQADTPVGASAALDLADTSTALRPDDIRLRFAAARIALVGGRIVDVDAALARLEGALAIAPRDPALLTERARLLLDRARRSGLPADAALAVTAHRERVAGDPANADAHVDLALALLQAGRQEEAEAVADRAAAVDPAAEGLRALDALLALQQPRAR